MPARPGVATAVVAAPWGPIHIAASDRGVVAVGHLVSDDEFVADLERRFPGRLLPASRADERDGFATDGPTPSRAMLARAVAAVEAFIAGDLNAFDAVPLDLADRPAWDRRVFDAVRAIPPGQTASYGDVARMIGAPGAARAVGGAVGRCPIGLAVPCHRVIAGDGTIGGYGGGSWGGREAGTALKRELLAREGVRLRASAARVRSRAVARARSRAAG